LHPERQLLEIGGFISNHTPRLTLGQGGFGIGKRDNFFLWEKLL
jgi:hypothetical protein